MTPKVDLTLYNKLKTSFSVEKGNIAIISLISENLDDLVFQSFTAEEFSTYWEIMSHHVDNKMPYVVLDHLDDYIYLFICKEFLLEENLNTGEITEFKLDLLKKIDFDADEAKKGLAQLASLLLRNSKAS